MRTLFPRKGNKKAFLKSNSKIDVKNLYKKIMCVRNRLKRQLTTFWGLLSRAFFITDIVAAINKELFHKPNARIMQVTLLRVDVLRNRKHKENDRNKLYYERIIVLTTFMQNITYNLANNRIGNYDLTFYS